MRTTAGMRHGSGASCIALVLCYCATPAELPASATCHTYFILSAIVRVPKPCVPQRTLPCKPSPHNVRARASVVVSGTRIRDAPRGLQERYNSVISEIFVLGLSTTVVDQITVLTVAGTMYSHASDDGVVRNKKQKTWLAFAATSRVIATPKAAIGILFHT